MEAKMLVMWGVILFLAVWLVKGVVRSQGAMIEIPINDR